MMPLASYLLWRPPIVSLPGASPCSVTPTSTTPNALDVAMVSSSSSFPTSASSWCGTPSPATSTALPFPPLPYDPNGGQGPYRIRIPTMVFTDEAVMAGDSLYWKLVGNFFGILEFDLVKQSLDVIRAPVDAGNCLKMMRAESGGFGCLVMSGCNAQLWKRETDCDGVAFWELARTIKLDKLLSLKSQGSLCILGIAEENNVVFLWTVIGLFMIHLESLKFKNLFKTNIISYYHPFESVYTAEICADGGHDGAGIVLNAKDDCPVGYAI